MSGEAEFRVPAEHATDVRLAALAELRHDGEWVAQMAEELSRHHVANDDWSLADVRGSSRCLANVLAYTEQAFERDGELILRGSSDDLAHLAETLVRQVLEPRLASEVNYSPFEDERAEKIAAASESVRWAADEAARLHGIWRAERAATKVEAS